MRSVVTFQWQYREGDYSMAFAYDWIALANRTIPTGASQSRLTGIGSFNSVPSIVMLFTSTRNNTIWNPSYSTRNLTTTGGQRTHARR